MLAKSGAMMHRMPKSRNAHGACSRELPQPKFGPPIRICAPRNALRLRTNPGSSAPSARYRQSLKRPLPRPVRVSVMSHRIGMIASVFTLARKSGAATALNRVKGFISCSTGQFPHVRDAPGYRRRCRHRGTRKMGPGERPLPPLEVAVGGRDATLARSDLVGVQAGAHGAPRFPPLEPGLDK